MGAGKIEARYSSAWQAKMGAVCPVVPTKHVRAKHLQNVCHEAVILGGEGAVAVVDELLAAVWLAINATAL